MANPGLGSNRQARPFGPSDRSRSAHHQNASLKAPSIAVPVAKRLRLPRADLWLSAAAEQLPLAWAAFSVSIVQSLRPMNGTLAFSTVFSRPLEDLDAVTLGEGSPPNSAPSSARSSRNTQNRASPSSSDRLIHVPNGSPMAHQLQPIAARQPFRRAGSQPPASMQANASQAAGISIQDLLTAENSMSSLER